MNETNESKREKAGGALISFLLLFILACLSFYMGALGFFLGGLLIGFTYGNMKKRTATH